MNYQKIGRICKKAKKLYIAERDGQQWAGSGEEIYAVEGMPIMSGDQMCRFLGLETDETSIITPGTENLLLLPLDDVDGTEEIVNGDGLKCCIAGREAVVFFHGAGAICVDAKKLTPLEKTCNLGYFKRGIYLAVKSGLYLIALICPMRIGEKDAETYAELANRLAISVKETEREGSGDDI